ncbi:hypothetical protein EST38_g4243 [Candolleomyces aberdarensis]|uniref:Transcription factor CBF/NF-Y/archaeal histone domain-containing protein n=1 Tax=Candolleomyces aberdarensis TaxID=2316362 RepID=A0A4V1Q4C6_9AGAR|nr:hypothetical protein EST38_g4243 [Candolleomyces aberdarensis]
MASSTSSSPVPFGDRDSSPELDAVLNDIDNDDIEDDEETQAETYAEEELEEEVEEETQDLFDEEFPAEAGDEEEGEEEEQTMAVDEETARAEAPDVSSTTKKRKKKEPVVLERQPAKSLFPVSRVQKIIKADKDIPIVAKDAVFLISMATEEFIRRIVVAGQRQARGDNRATVKHQDLASVVRRIDEFMFLEEILPWMAPGLAPKRTSKVKELASAPGLKAAPTMLDQFVSVPKDSNETSGKRGREDDDVVMRDDP